MALGLDGTATRAGRPDDSSVGAGGGIPQPRTPRRLLGSRRRQIIAGVVIAAALVFLAVQGLSNATIYFKTADQAVADRASLGTKPFRIEGMVVNDVAQNGQTVRFDLSANGVTVPIVDTGSPPQLFKPGIPVVLQGHWQGRVYASDQIMVKHTASYTEAHPNRVKGQPAPPAPRSGS
ncbi:MAG: cytochrome c maturation protein CcmE [Actinomycetota bacterium]|nr:cytochrome c maturation protein CcmE [Actinomycetota bacterium]